MPDWRRRILEQFTPEVSRITVATDPDGLLTEELLYAAITGLGFSVLPFEDPIEFRYRYESEFRARWDQGSESELVVVDGRDQGDSDDLPFDVLTQSRRVSLSLASLFPRLSYPVLRGLDKSMLDRVDALEGVYGSDSLGDDQTRDLVLRHVYKLDPALIDTPEELLRALLRRHHQNAPISADLDGRLVSRLKAHASFRDWPLEQIVPSRDQFLRFVQERWDRWIASLAGVSARKPLTLPGPLLLPFEHSDVRVFIDTLFLEGALEPAVASASVSEQRPWVAVGIRQGTPKDPTEAVSGLLRLCKEAVEAKPDRYQDWMTISLRWAEVQVAWWTAPSGARKQLASDYSQLRGIIDTAFGRWVTTRYASLASQPPNPPVMVHHVPRFLGRQVEASPSEKIALVVVDGLALEQWLVLRSGLRETEPQLRFTEGMLFAWLPSLTSVSRQALLSGKLPLAFGSSIGSTASEPSHWQQYWHDHGIPPAACAYGKLKGDEDPEAALDSLLRPGTRTVAIVVNKVDDISHGMELGAEGMHNQVRLWAQGGFMGRLFAVLATMKFRIFLTADHGNVEAVGSGVPQEGVLADQRGQRVRVYPTQELRAAAAAALPAASSWDPVGLPPGLLPLFPAPRAAFATVGSRVVAHGGPSIEEIVVPWIEIRREAL